MSAMELDLRRLEHDGVATRGELHDGARRLCYTLEDRYRPVKLAGETRIPAGRYRLELKPVGASRFDDKAARVLGWDRVPYLGMIRLADVPGFSEVLIHWGNYHTNTEGCVLVGRTKMENAGVLAVGASQAAFADIYPAIAQAAHALGPGAWLTIRNLDGTPEGK